MHIVARYHSPMLCRIWITSNLVLDLFADDAGREPLPRRSGHWVLVQVSVWEPLQCPTMRDAHPSQLYSPRLATNMRLPFRNNIRSSTQSCSFL